ncbi:Uncharacterized protein Rs2_04967 [Raphanus sativus]|nr:Uncharacterized protein Rs2_04967 [Raphanus sativus]
MEVLWNGCLARPINGSYQHWRYVIRLDRGLQGRAWPDMIREAQDLVRSSIRDTGPSGKGRIIVELIHPCGMDWLRAMKKSKTDQVHWYMVPLPVRFRINLGAGSSVYADHG